MDEINHVDHRATSVVHETDRTSPDLLAKIYQRIAEAQASLEPNCDGVQGGVRITDKPVSTQEAQR